MPDKIDLLFDDLQSRGYAKDKTRKQFRDYMLAPGKQGYENRRTFFEDFKSNGETSLGSYEDFKGLLGLHATKKQQAAPSVYQKAQGGGGLGQAMRNVSAKVRQSRAAGQPQAKVQQAPQNYIARPDSYTSPGSLVGQLEKRDEQAETAMMQPLRDISKKVEDRSFTPQRAGTQYVDEEGNVVKDETYDVYPLMPQEVAEDIDNRAAYEAMTNRWDAEKEIDEDLRDIRSEEEKLTARRKAAEGGKDPSEKTWWDFFREGFGASAVGAVAPMGVGVDADVVKSEMIRKGAYGKERQDIMKDMDTLIVRKRLAEDAKQIIADAQKDKDGYSVLGGLARAGEKVLEKARDIDIWDFGANDMATQMAVAEAVIKADSGLGMTENERKLLDTWAKNAAVNSEFGDQISGWTKAGMVTGESLPFMLEMAMNPASGLGQAATKQLLKYSLKKYGPKWVKDHAKSMLAKKIATRVVGDVVGAGVMASTSGAARVAADYERRMTGQVEIAADDKGNIIYNGVKQDTKDNPAAALFKAFASTSIENWSEMAGNYLGFLNSFFGKALGKAAIGKAGRRALQATGSVEGVSLNKAQKFIYELAAEKGIGAFSNGLKQFADRTQWHGVMNEYLEEVMGNIANAAVVGDMTFDTAEDTGVFNLEQNIDTFCGVALMGGFMSTLNTAGYAAHRYNYDVDRVNEENAKIFGDELWEGVKTMIDNSYTDPRELNDALTYILRGESGKQYTAEEKKAVLKYTQAVLEKEGAEMAQYQPRMDSSTVEEVTTPEGKKYVVTSLDKNGESIEQRDFDDEEEAKAYEGELKMNQQHRDYKDYLSMVNKLSYPEASDAVDEFMGTLGIDENSEDYADTVAAINDPKSDLGKQFRQFKLDKVMQKAEASRAAIESFEEENGWTPGTVAWLAEQDPMQMDSETLSMADDARAFLEGLAYPAGEVHVEHEQEKGSEAGQSVVENVISTEEPIDPEHNIGKDIQDQWTAAQAARQQMFDNDKTGDIQSQVESLEKSGFTPQEIISQLETFSPEQRQVMVDYYNAQARYQSMIDTAAKQIDNAARRSRNNHTFRGTINGQADVQSVHKITDGVNEYYLVSGNVTTDSSGRITGSTSGLIIGMDLDGSFVQLNDGDGYSVMPVDQTLDQYEEAERIRLQQQVTSVIDPNGALRPQGAATASPQSGQATGNGAQPAEGPQSHLREGDLELWPQVKEWLDAHPDATVAQIQREFRIGYNKATRMRDEYNRLKQAGGQPIITGGRQGAQPAVEAGQEQTGADEAAGETPAEAAEGGTTLDRIPKDEKGSPLYEQASSEDTYDALLEQVGNKDTARVLVQNQINKAKERLKKLQKKMETGDFEGNSFQEQIEASKKLQQSIDEEEGRIKYWTSVLTVPQKRMLKSEPTAPTETAETETPAAETPATETPSGEVPEWRYDTPEAARERGYKIIEGNRVDRQQEKDMPKGMEVEVQYSTKDKVKGRMTVSELGDVQGSHLTNGQRNERHFLPEAQPKSEFGADRQAAAQANASEENFRPELMLTFNGTQSAYSGSASQTNKRGEVIQGNGRRNLAEYIYAPGNEAVAKKYKEFLMAHAEELGTTAEEIAKMEKPFAHIVLDVSDEEAIRLGQFTAQDLESGGKKVPEVSTVTTKLGDKYSSLANIILKHEDPDASLADRIDANSEEAVKWLNNGGFINNTEAKTLLEDKALCRQFIKDLITDQLFKDAHPDLRTMFYELPKNIQSAIISVVGREVAIENGKSILKDIQESIRAYHELTVSSPEFANATGSNFEKRQAVVTAAVNDWLRQINIDGTVNSEKFSNFALGLAKLYKSLKDQKTLAGRLRDYYDLASGTPRELGMFDAPASAEPMSKEEIIKQIFGIEYGRQRTVPLAGDNQGSEEGREGSADSTESGESEQEGAGQADNRGGDTVDAEGLEERQTKAEPQPAENVGGNEIAEEKTGQTAPSMEEIKEASGVEETAEEPNEEDNPSGNKIVTDARYEELKKRMRDKLLGQMNVGVDPEILAIGVEMAVYHIEKGARKFADYARGMIEDLGDVIRPYLKAFYNGARDLPEMSEYVSDMDDYQTVQSFDVANFDKRTADPVEQAKEIADEDKVEKDVKKAKENIKIVAKENKKKKKNISSQQDSGNRIAGKETEQQLDLFNLNAEENEQEIRRDEGLPAEQGSGSESEGQDSGDTERVREGGSLEQDRPLQSGLSGAVEEAEAEPQPAEKKNQRNNRNARGKDYAPSSPVARVKANVAAIRLLKQLEAEDRDATPEEMEVLKQYSGWGGLGGAFNENSPYYNEVRDVLDDAEYDSAAMSINSAYYTPASIIDRLWDVAARLGFKGGKILESSAGIGNIIASIPESMNERSDIEMVEIDSISGRILEKLYPDAKVNIKGFEDTRVENGSVDLAITNVPFVTGLKVRDEVDTDLSRQFGNIHDFVIAKNIRKLKEGGIGIFITTSNTLDKSDALREWIDGKGDTDVMGVFRLNNETFGGTNVTSDIIVVRKRVNGERHPDAIDVMQSSVVRDGEYENQDGKYDWKAGKYETKRTSMRVNNYLNEHPENMGGEMAFNYEKGDTFRPGGYGLYPSEKNQEQLLDAWVQKMKNVFAAVTRQRTQQEDTDVREGRMFIKDGKIYVSQQGKAVPYAAKKAKVKGKSVEECVKDYVAIRESLSDVLKYQLENESDENLKPLLDKLNKAYDDFVKKYGYLHKNTAISFLRDDVEFPDIAALENYSETKDIKGNKIVRVGKSKVFDGRVLRFKTEPKPQNVKDGVLASVQQFGKIDLGWLASVLPNQTENSIKAEILNSGYGFEDPVTKKVEVRYEYLSGNVREKLRQARENNTDGRYNKNIDALEKVLPMDIPAHLIDFSLGSSWIDPKLYEDFVKDRYGCTVRFVNAGGVWSMEVLRGEYDEKNRAGGVHSKLLGDTIPASKLVEAAINNRTVKVQKTYKEWDGSKRTETDKAATQACQTRIGEIKDEFTEWAKAKMQSDVDMAEKMMRVYNDKFNSMVPKEVDDTFVPEHFEGAVDYIHLYPHQSKAVMRAVTEPVMLAHQVGAGKTFTLITTAMEMRRLGTAKKPMIVVQNATIGQFVAAAKTLYPNAKILSLTEKDRDAEGRRSFYGKIKYNDWDMIVIPQSTFERIPDSPERQQEFIQEKIDDKMHALEVARQANADDRLIKQMERDLDDLVQERDDVALGREPSKGKKGKKKDEEKTKKNVAARAKEQLDRHADDVMYFDDMGIDALLIDEAHEYKRLGFSTTMGRGVKGIDPAGSKKAAGVYLKTRGILKSNGWKNVVFATGTPISNTAAEIWTFMRYLMPKEVLEENDIWYFDDFVHNFGKVAQSLEFATNGKFKENTRFAAYINKPELIRIWSTVADTVLAKDMPSVAEKLPEKENGKDQDVFLPQTQSLVGIMRAVRKRLEEFEKMSGAEKRANSSIPLVMYGLAKRAAIDPRLVDAGAIDEPNSKTNKATDEIVKDLASTEAYKGTAAVFCDMQNGPEGFNIFQEMKRKLVEKGIPENQIAIITSGMTIPQKEKIFEQVNNGDIRVIMGSTQTLGTGVNIQERLHLLIHMDAPDRPMDYTQRNGRILRQGNLHKEWGLPIRILRFGVEDSLDVTSYQRLKTKSGFIDSIMDGKGALLNNQVDRTLEEEEEGLFDNPVAVLSGSQYALKKTQAERELRKWQSKRQQWESDQIYIENTIRRNNGQNKEAEERIKGYDKTIELAKKHFPDGKASTITIKGVETKNEEELQQALTEQVNKPIRERVDNYRKDFGFTKGTIKIPMKFDDVDVNVEVTIERETEYVQGKGMKTTMHTTFRYTIPALGLDEPSMERGFIKDIISDIREDISAQPIIDRRDAALRGIEKRTADNEQLEARRSPTFKDEAKLVEAREKVAEYTEKMKEEMAEKEAKYAAMDAKDVDIDSIEENAEEEEEQSADTGRRYDEDIEGNDIAGKEVTNVIVDSTKTRLPHNRKEALEVVSKIPRPFINKDQGKEIVVYNSAVKHTATQGRSNADTQCLGVIDQIIAEAVKIGELPPKEGKEDTIEKCEIYYCPVNIDGVQYSARLVVNQHKNRGFVLDDYQLYDLRTKEKSGAVSQATGQNALTSLSAPDSRYKIKNLIWNNKESDKNLVGINNRKARFDEDEAATASQHSEHKGRIAEHVDALVEKLGTKERTTVYHSFDELPEADKEYIRSRERQGKKVRGWYENGHIYLYLPHIDSKYQAEKTLWHETVAHHGLRELVGAENYDKLLRQLWLEHRDGEMGKWVTERMQQNGWNLNEAIDEYLAREAEKHPFEQPSLWQRLRWLLADVLHKIGFATDPTISDIQYLFWVSQNRLREGDALSVAKQQAFLHRLDRAAMQSPVNGRNNGERMYDEDIEEPLERSAKAVYEDRLNRVETVFSEAYQDAMVSLKTAQNAIAKDKEIPDSQNAYMAENLMHGKNKNEQDLYNIEYRDPLIETINKIMTTTGMNWGDVDRYVYTKSGLERNREFFVRDWLEAERGRTIRKYEDLNEEEQEIFDRKAASIETLFEDGDIDEAEKNKRLRLALQEAHMEYLDDIESEWHRVKDERYSELWGNEITYPEYLGAMTDFIQKNIDESYDPSEHDYSGFRAMFGDAEGKYDEADIIDELMDTEDRINSDDYDFLIPTVEKLWEQIRKATRYGLERYREAGMRSDEQIDEIESMFHFYVPMRGFKEDKGEDMYQYFTGKGRTKSYVGGLLKHAKGRGSEAEYPISTIFAMTYKAIADCNQNMVNQKLYRLCQANPNDLIVLSDSWAVLNTETGQWEESGPDIPADATEDEVRNITLAWEDEMRRLSLEGKAKKITGRPRFDYVPLDKEKKSEHEIDVRINGKPRKMFVVGNPRMAQALNGQLRFEKGRNVFSKLNAAIKNFMASLFTSYSPTFALRNMMRDWTHFRTMLGVREGEGYARQANKYYRQSLFKMVGLFKKYRAGKLDMSKEIERDFKDFMDNGGITGFVQMLKIDDIQKQMEKLYKQQKEGKPIRLNNALWDYTLGAIEALNEGIENNARFATFRASRHYAGRTKARSAYDAKEITVNFNRKGAGGKTAGFKSDKRVVEDAAKLFGVSSQILGEGRIFFNATVQAIATTFKNFQNADGSLNKKYIAKWAGKYALPPFMFGLALPMINKMLAAALDGGDGDDDPYANLPEWTRRKNICIYAGNNNFITIPIGQELAAFLTLGDIFAGNTYAQELKPVDRDLGDEMVDVMNTFSPVDISTKITKGGMMEDPISEVTGRTFSVLAPLVAVEQNLSWTGRPIYREDKFKNDKYVPEYQMVYSGTNPVMVSASQKLHELGGGNDRARGKEWSEVNPAIIQYLWEQYTGGPGKVFSNTISIGKDVKDYVSGKGSDFNIRKVEGIKAFIQQGDDRTQYYRAQSKFYKYQEDADKFKYDHDVSGLEKQAKTDPAAKLELDSLMKTPEYQRYAIIKEVNRSSKKEGKVGLDELRKEIYRIADRKEKRAKMQTYNHLMKEVVDLLDQVGKE